MRGTDLTSISLLLFSVGGVRFGCDADQAAGVTAGEAQEGDELILFHEELAGGAWQVNYHDPTIVTIKSDHPRPYRVMIDAMNEIASFSRYDIRLFPVLLEPFVVRRGIWGILPHKGALVLLVDFQLLLHNKTAKSVGTRHEETL